MARASKASTAGKKAAGKAAKKKSTAKTPAAKKSTKTAAKNSSAPKSSATKTPATKAQSTNEKAPVKKATPKKAAAKKAAPKKAAPKKAAPKKAAPKKAAPKKTKSPFDSKFLEQMKKLLQTERDTYERQAANLRAEADQMIADIEPGDVQFDEESGEGDTIAVERNRDLALSAKALEMIEEIDHAASKFELGTYGICEVSGEPIPKERLEAIPWAREKVEYKVGGFGRR